MQEQRFDAVCGEGGGELVEELDTVGQGQAAPAALGGVSDVGGDLLSASEFVNQDREESPDQIPGLRASLWKVVDH
ncbi:hypothetical protein, partial [Streptomyces sp. NPDC057909]|uniref:hypothetical protein n=1 Tax=Streptomyces sp. NPDC057909 TaxID=3346277 RepID=UPI0036E941C4